MNVTKKYDRFRQWGREKMGADVKTTTTDDFKNLEQEMDSRHDGMDKLHNSMNAYVKYISKKSEGDARDKTTPTSHLGAAMTRHGEDFESGSKFGECLTKFGETQERVARIQDSYAVAAKSSWLDACARSIAMMKDYQNARKKLEARRLAYDTSQSKMHKSKREDYRAEEELRAQKAKYDESIEDVTRRMQDIIDAEADNMADLQTFLDAELNYHDRCREVLLQLKHDWPAGDTTNPTIHTPRQTPRPRPSTTNMTPAHRVASVSTLDEQLPSPASSNPSPQKEHSSFTFTNGVYTPPQSSRSASPATTTRSRNDSNASASAVYHYADALPSNSTHTSSNTAPTANVSAGRTPTPLSAISTPLAALATVNTAATPTPGGLANKKPPPPPPPSRATKPKPPPPAPPLRSALSTSAVPSSAW